MKIQRVRDPVHGLIVFGEEGDVTEKRRDRAAWRLLNTPEFQRLRRVKQLGVSDFTFPRATHSRFSHSIGVYHIARKLVQLLERQLLDHFDSNKANIAILAALVHDLGHGPFSHAFEAVQEARGAQKTHETWTSEIILNQGGAIYKILEDFDEGAARRVANLLRSDAPQDEYHAVVSSSFDADRLDYLRRDRLMTGSGAGAIDFDWLIDNIRIDSVSITPDEEEDLETFVRTFCIDQKAIQAAESFLLARYHLFAQIYLHKTTRSMEIIVGRIIGAIAQHCRQRTTNKIGLRNTDPLVRFFSAKGETLENYIKLDDLAVWSAIMKISEGKDPEAADFALRFIQRRPLKSIDVNTIVPIEPNESFDEVNVRRQAKCLRVEELIGEKLGKTVFKDSEPISVYGEIGADVLKRHKKLSIRLVEGQTREITQLSPTIRTLAGKRPIVRFYFVKEADRQSVLEGLRR